MLVFLQLVDLCNDANIDKIKGLLFLLLMSTSWSRMVKQNQFCFGLYFLVYENISFPIAYDINYVMVDRIMLYAHFLLGCFSQLGLSFKIK